MAEMEEKEEKIRGAFVRTIMDEKLDENMFEEFIKAYSYYISQINRDYKYNQTYLPTYLERFKKFKRALENKREKIEVIKEACDILNDIEFGADTKIKVWVDKFWEISRLEGDAENKFTGVIDEAQITSNNIFIEVEIKNEYNERARWTRQIWLGERDYKKSVEEFFTNIVSAME